MKNGKPKRRLLKFALISLVVVAVGGAAALAALDKPVGAEVGEVVKGTLVVTINEDGRSRVKDRFVVSAPLTGTLGRIELHPGDEVKRGAVLARLVPVGAPLLDNRSRARAEASVSAAQAGILQANAQIDRAEAALDFATKEEARVASLVASGALSQQELDRTQLEKRARQAELTSAKFGAKVAGHELTMARAALGVADGSEKDGHPLTVTSPIGGRVLRVIHESEGVVQAGTQLLELGDPAALELVVDVLTSDAVNIHPGSAVQVENWGGESLKAAVRMVEPSAFTRVSALGIDEQRVNAIIDLNEPYDKWHLLGDGYRVEARIEVYRSPEATLVPQSALFRHDQEWAAYVVENRVAHRRTVKVGRRNETSAEIVEGLEPGARVVTHPSDKVADGVLIEPL